MTYGLVLEGGGLRGNYTAGVMDAFLDRGLVFPYVIGVSAGAGMGVSLVSRQRGRNLEVLKRFRNDPRYLSLGSYLRTGNLFGLDFIYDEIPRRYIPLDFEALYASPSRFIAVASNVETGKPEYLEDKADVLQAMKASSAMPFVSRIQEYRGLKLLDGGICDAIPLARAQSEGYPLNVVVLTHPANYRRRREKNPPAFLWYRRYPRFLEALDTYVDRYNRTLEWVEEEARNKRVILIRPSRDLHVSRTEKDMDKLLRLYELGLEDGRAAPLELPGAAPLGLPGAAPLELPGAAPLELPGAAPIADNP